jgi:peptidyl-Asp metalloendopeptidase
MKCTKIAVGLSFALLTLSGAALAAQQSPENLFGVASNRAQVLNPGQYLRALASDPVNERIEIVSARADLIASDTQEINLNLPGGLNVLAKQTSFERMESGNEVWVGSIQTNKFDYAGFGIPVDAHVNQIIAVKSGDTVMANVYFGDSLYRLVPVDDGAHALVEANRAKFAPDESEEGYKQMQANSNSVEKESSAPVANRAIDTIRVMVAFGPAARAQISNPQQATDLAITESNNALAATNTEARFQQAGGIQNFNETESTNYSTMLSRLTNLSDGRYDTIGTARNTNTADLVAYVGPISSGLCGQAAGIGVSSGSGYFIMNPTCLSGNYTFVHEAAHLVGARHDNDPTTSPFAYGHGFVMTSISRRTIMAVNSNTCCTRIGAFSSPNYTSQGVTIGTANFNDNNRVWRARKTTVAAFR